MRESLAHDDLKKRVLTELPVFDDRSEITVVFLQTLMSFFESPQLEGTAIISGFLLALLEIQLIAAEASNTPLVEMSRAEIVKRLALVSPSYETLFVLTVRTVVETGRAPHLGRLDVPGKEATGRAMAALEALLAEASYTVQRRRGPTSSDRPRASSGSKADDPRRANGASRFCQSGPVPRLSAMPLISVHVLGPFLRLRTRLGQCRGLVTLVIFAFRITNGSSWRNRELIDSSIVRAHQHAAGGKGGPDHSHT